MVISKATHYIVCTMQSIIECTHVHVSVFTVPSHQTSGARNSESESPSEEQVPSTPARPPMADVLRDIGSVKLRTVETVRYL